MTREGIVFPVTDDLSVQTVEGKPCRPAQAQTITVCLT
jgi:hypothetical protein